MQEASAGIGIAPEIHGDATADLPHPRNQRFRIHRLGDVVAPGDRIEGAQQVGYVWSAGACADVAGLTGELIKGGGSGRANDRGVLNLRQAFLKVLAEVSAATRLGVPILGGI